MDTEHNHTTSDRGTHSSSTENEKYDTQNYKAYSKKRCYVFVLFPLFITLPILTIFALYKEV